MRSRTITLLLLVLVAAPASAHRPYAVKEKILGSPQGAPLILEKLFGDGIFTADPVSLQLRNSHGAILAYTMNSQHVGVFCPALKRCWAYPHDSYIGLSGPWRLDFDHLEFGKEISPEEKGRIEEVGRVTYGFENPLNREEFRGFKKESSILLRLASPIFVFLDHIFVFTLLALTCVLPFILKSEEARLTASRQGAAKVGLRFVFGLLGAANAVILLIQFYLILSFLAPWLYALVIGGASYWAGRRYIRLSPQDPAADIKRS